MIYIPMLMNYCLTEELGISGRKLQRRNSRRILSTPHIKNTIGACPKYNGLSLPYLQKQPARSEKETGEMRQSISISIHLEYMLPFLMTSLMKRQVIYSRRKLPNYLIS